MFKAVFYKTRNGNEVVRDVIRKLDAADRLIIGEELWLAQNGFPMGMPLCSHLGGGIWELRSSLSTKREFRLLFFHHARLEALVIVNAFVKKSQKTPKAELHLAMRRMREYLL